MNVAAGVAPSGVAVPATVSTTTAISSQLAPENAAVRVVEALIAFVTFDRSRYNGGTGPPPLPSRTYVLPTESVTDVKAGALPRCRSVTRTKTVSPTGMLTPNPGVVKDRTFAPAPVADVAAGTGTTATGDDAALAGATSETGITSATVTSSAPASIGRRRNEPGRNDVILRKGCPNVVRGSTRRGCDQ